MNWSRIGPRHGGRYQKLKHFPLERAPMAHSAGRRRRSAAPVPRSAARRASGSPILSRPGTATPPVAEL